MRHKLAEIMGRIAYHTFAIQLPDYGTVVSLDRELLAWRDNLPSFSVWKTPIHLLISLTLTSLSSGTFSRANGITHVSHLIDLTCFEENPRIAGMRTRRRRLLKVQRRTCCVGERL